VYMGFARQATTRIMMLDSGIILEQGPPDQIFENPTHSRTREFLSKIF
jgi:ABC-type histidine transport system ATPase subunit